MGFEHEVPEDKIVDDLQGALVRDHGGALIAWVVAGAVAYLQNGLRAPESVMAATQDYAHDQDTVERFLEDMCHAVDSQDVATPVGQVRAAYEKWCSAEGETPVSGKAFGIALSNRGIESKKRGKGVRHYLGLMLLAADDAPPDAPPDAPFDWNQVYR